ncbi:FTR1 family iron permease [Acidithrix ferrooxidans]|uniref:Ferrous iron permease EfeU n=2 Tax=root TaxID=1 RepID=A0A0D8HEY0_9ACTN|nr:FTR1 family protein [Acidithrix ferrooxidans]KJF16478.1 ferrous iron permease EfeU [Acidithrix ferrooxidans]
MLATLVIFLREGIEASLIVAILLAYLDKIGKRENFKDVILGVSIALAFALIAGTVIYLTLKDYAGTRLQTQFETVTYLIAAGVMTYMTFWMTSHSRKVSTQLKKQTNEALERGARLGIAIMAAQAVGREALEAMVFTLAIVFATSAKGAIIGGAIGLLASLAFAFSIYRLGKKLDIAKAFRILGIALMAFGAGLLVDAAENLQSLGYLPLLRETMWNSSSLLPDSSTLGDIVHSFFGYASTPTVLQGIVWITYLVTVMTIYIRLTHTKMTKKAL